jgi:hypothetical protein
MTARRLVTVAAVLTVAWLTLVAALIGAVVKLDAAGRLG